MTWQIRSTPDVLTGGVHVWRARLDRAEDETARLAGVLSEDERARATRLKVPLIRARFVTGRAILRSALGLYVDCEPSALRFLYREHGKPYLEPGTVSEELSFNLSHSHGLALFAFTRGREIGVDLERIRAERDHEKLAKRFFAPVEVAELAALDPGKRVEAFFNGWTRKEAYLKARGEGLALPLASFSVSLAPGRPAALLSVAADSREASRWSLHELDAGMGFAAALAVEGCLDGLSLYEWPDSASKPEAP